MRETSVRHLLVTSTFQRAAKRAAKPVMPIVACDLMGKAAVALALAARA
jgi:hypothetical protein